MSLTNITSSLPPDINAYNGAGCTNVPGVTNLLYAPGDIKNTVKALFKAYAQNDREALLDTLVRLSGMPANIAHAVLSGISTIMQIGAFFKLINHSPLPFTLPIAIFGLTLSSLEGIYEIVGLKRSIKFSMDIQKLLIDKIPEILNAETHQVQVKKLKSLLNALKGDIRYHYFSQRLLTTLNEWEMNPAAANQRLVNILEYLKEPLTQQALEQLHSKFFTIDQKAEKKVSEIMLKHSHLSESEKKAKEEEVKKKILTVKKNQLARRIRPWLALQLENELPNLITGLKSSDPTHRAQAMKRGEEILSDVKTQTDKKVFLTILGVITLLITIVGFALMLAAIPYIPLIILTIGGALSILSFALNAGMMDNKGWNITWSNCIPEWVKKLYHKIFTRTVKELELPTVQPRSNFKIPFKKSIPISCIKLPSSATRGNLSSCFAFPKAGLKLKKLHLSTWDHHYKLASPSLYLRA